MTTVTKAGRYEIVGELGRGAMGVVYKATDPVIGRTVAVKTIRLSTEGTGLSRPELLTRFQTEARAAGLLTHPNIVVVFDAGEEDGLYYITMELVEGKSLQALIDSGQAFPLPRILRIMEQTCNALQFAHERNVVHRDIKPANLMLTGDDTVKVTDFGTAKILQIGTVQQTAHVMGTPSYMSPEQVKGRAVDGRSDIFSLGVMLYEIVTGEKPFPGQNITTVIYKIVNEEPVPPRQIDPTIHPGISAVVMKALAKEPDQRYQSCREMLDELKSYRLMTASNGNPQSTMMANSGGSPAATMALGSAGFGGREDENRAAVTARSLASRATNPSQTPLIRRTATVAPYEEPKKKSLIGSIFGAIVLLGVIGYGGYKLRPVFMAARDLRAAQNKTAATNGVANPSVETNSPGTVPPNTPSDSSLQSTITGATKSPAPIVDASTSPVASPPITNAKPKEVVVERPVPKKVDDELTPKAAELKGRIEEAITEKGLTGRASVKGAGSTLTLNGKLRPQEHSGLLGFLHNTPPEVHVVDHIEYDDAPVAPSGNAGDSGHPVPNAGLGAIHVVTDVIGATAVLHGPAGHVRGQCQTPCSFNNLNPARYSLEVKKDGYQPVQTALQVKQANVLDQKIQLQSLAEGLFITSDPPGADVFVNGDKQSGQTPVTLPLAPGQYNLVLRLAGHSPYVGKVQVKDNIQTQMEVKLNERSAEHVAWADVETTPKGAEIFVDGVDTGQVTPARIQITSGIRTFVLKMNNFQQVQRKTQVSDGGTITIQETLKAK